MAVAVVIAYLAIAEILGVVGGLAVGIAIGVHLATSRAARSQWPAATPRQIRHAEARNRAELRRSLPRHDF